MTVSASQVTAALRKQLLGASGTRLHHLLYYVQGHHYALRGRPAFAAQILAGPEGPYIGGTVERAQEGADRYTPDRVAQLREEVRQARAAARDEPPAPTLTVDEVSPR